MSFSRGGCSGSATQPGEWVRRAEGALHQKSKAEIRRRDELRAAKLSQLRILIGADFFLDKVKDIDMRSPALSRSHAIETAPSRIIVEQLGEQRAGSPRKDSLTIFPFVHATNAFLSSVRVYVCIGIGRSDTGAKWETEIAQRVAALKNKSGGRSPCSRQFWWATIPRPLRMCE